MVVAAHEPCCAESRMQHFLDAKLSKEAFHKATSERKHGRAIYMQAHVYFIHFVSMAYGSLSRHVRALMSGAEICMFAFHGFSFMSTACRECSRDRPASRQSGNAKAAAQRQQL